MTAQFLLRDLSSRPAIWMILKKTSMLYDSLGLLQAQRSIIPAVIQHTRFFSEARKSLTILKIKKVLQANLQYRLINFNI